MNLQNIIYLKIISPGTLLTLKIVSVIISFIFIFFIIYFLRKTSWMRWRYTQDIRDLMNFKTSYEAKRLEKAWAKIKKRLERPLESEYKLAVIEADDFLNDILRGMKYKGESFGERLKQVTPDILPNVEEVKRVHEIRNNIVHDPDYQLSLEQAQSFIKTFEKSLQDLNIFS